MSRLASLSYEQTWNDHWMRALGSQRRLRILDANVLDLRHPSCNLGELDKFPPEILTLVLLEVDLKTLVSFRAINRRASIMVNSIRQYRAILTMRVDAREFALSIGELPWISCKTLYSAITERSCSRCGEFAGHIYLLTCERACLPCLSYHQDFLPLSPAHAQHEFGIGKKIVDRLPASKRPWSHWADSKVYRLIDRQSALNAAVEFHGSYEQMQEFITARAAKLSARYQERLGRLKLIPNPKRQPFMRAFRYPDKKAENPMRFTAVSRAPAVDKKTGSVTWGISCRSCYVSFVRTWSTENNPKRANSLRMYSIDEFIEHVRGCEDALQAMRRLGF